MDQGTVIIKNIELPENTEICIDDIHFTEETLAEILGLQRDEVKIEYDEIV